VCDVAESCDGVHDVCPADAAQPAGTVCRPAAGACDLAETCDGSSVACPPDAFQPAATTCRASTGVCDPAEQCSGTSASCPADVRATDTDGDGVCDLVDDCPLDPDPAQADSDGDGIGDACDPCTNIVPVFAVASRITIKHIGSPRGHETLTFRGVITVPTTPAIDPASKGARVMVDDAEGQSVLDAIIPGGFDAATGVGWKTNRAGTAWRYGNKSGPLGITNVQVRSSRGRPGRLKFRVRGRNGAYAMSPNRMPLKGTMVIDSPIARTGQCGEALFTGPSSVPRCTFNRTGITLHCK